jgi:hypothetical protein
MAVEGAPDAHAAPVTPSDASPDHNHAPAPDDGQEAVRDTAALERSREAAGYRTRLRAAEGQLAERDALVGAMREEVDRLHRVEAERLADASMGTPGDLWLVVELSDLRDDAGRLDTEKVKAKVAEVVADRPSWRRRTPGFDGGARTTAPTTRRPGLADLLGKGEAR